MSSALAMILAAGMTVPGDVPKEATEEIEQRLDLNGEWEGTWDNGRKTKSPIVHLSGTRISFSEDDAAFSFEHRIVDEGGNKLRFNDNRPSIYRQDGDRLDICIRWHGKGRPTSFRGGDGQVLLILHRVKPGK